MRIVIGLLAVTAAACSDDGNMFPVGGGGNDGGFTLPDGNGGGGTDAATDGASDAAAPEAIDASIFVGRVCLATDPRKLNTCATTGAGGLTVRLGSATTTTAADGTFSIPGQSASNVWHVTGTSIVSSHMVVGDYEIPAITKATYDQMITDNLQGLKLNPGEGSLMVQLIKNGQGAQNVFGETAPLSAWEAFYDAAGSPTTWQQAASGVDGTAWFAGLDVGTVSVTMTLGDDVTKSGLPIVDGGITFTTVIFP